MKRDFGTYLTATRRMIVGDKNIEVLLFSGERSPPSRNISCVSCDSPWPGPLTGTRRYVESSMSARLT